MNISNRALTLLWLLFALMLVIVSSAPGQKRASGSDQDTQGSDPTPGSNAAPGSDPAPGSNLVTSTPQVPQKDEDGPSEIPDAGETDVTTVFDYSTILEIVTDGDASTTVRPTTVTTRSTTQSRNTQEGVKVPTVRIKGEPTSPATGTTTKLTTPTSPKTTSQPTTNVAATTLEQQQETSSKPDEAAKPATSKARTKTPPTVPDTKVKTDGPNYSQGQTVSQMLTKQDTGGFLPPFDKDSFTAKVILPIAAGIVLAVFIVLIGCSVRSCLEKNGKNNSRKRLMEHDMAPADRVMLLAESSEDEF